MSSVRTSELEGLPLVLASRWQRLGAVLIDVLIMPVIYFTPHFSAMVFDITVTTGIAVVRSIILLIIIIVQIVLLGTRGQTIGKRALKIRIVDYRTGAHPGFTRVVLMRVIVNGLIVLPLLGTLFIFREDKRCIHDFIANTKVVNVDKAEMDRAMRVMENRRRAEQMRLGDDGVDPP